jgi:hypothetical protein
MSNRAAESFARRTRMIKARRDLKARRHRRYKIAVLEQLEQRIVLSNGTITLIPISTPFNNPIGMDYQEPTNSLIISDNYSTGVPHNFDRINQNGTQSQFSR